MTSAIPTAIQYHPKQGDAAQLFPASPLLETLFEGGSSPVNEDALVTESPLFGVFDGSTSLSAKTYHGSLTGGYLAATLSARIFKQATGSLRTLAKQANAAIGQAMERQGIDRGRKEELWSTSAAVVRLQDDHLEWCQIGDCLIQVLYTNGTSSLLVEPPAHDAPTLSLWRSLGPGQEEPIHTTLASEILAVRRRMNIDYGVLSGEPEAMTFLNSGVIPLAGVAAILLYSDGLVLPCHDESLQNVTERIAALFRQGGLRAVRNQVKSLQHEDPSCHLYPRFKFSDDISAIALSCRS